MSRDPYVDVKREVEQSLATAQDLLDSSHTPDVVDQLREAITSLEADLEDLEESVRVVEETGDRWGLGADEISRRRAFIDRVEREVGKIKNKLSARKGKGKAGKKGDASGRYRDLPDEEERVGDGEEARRWEMEEQQTLMRRQDDTLGVISGTLTNLASQAGLIGHEVHEQSEMLEDLDTRIDHTDSRLRKVSRTMQDFIRRNEETKSGYCICILIVVLIILLMAVILT